MGARLTTMSNDPLKCALGNRARAYHTVAPLARNLESVDLDIITPGDAGDTWTLITMGVPLQYVVQDGDSSANVADALRTLADAIGGVTATGATSHVILTRDAAVTVHAPQLFESLETCGLGTAEMTVLDTETLSGRGELSVRQSGLDPTPLDAFSNPSAVDLDTAEAFVILAKTGISSAGVEAITGDMGISPGLEAAITGFTLTPDGSGEFSTTPEVTGNVYASDYSAPTPATLAAAIVDMDAAYTDAASRTPDTVNLGGGAIGGMTLEPGVYSWPAGVTIGSDLTLDGGAGDRWIFQVGTTLTLAAAQEVLLTGGALPENVVWQVGGAVSVGAGSVMRGVVLGNTSVAIAAAGEVEGRLFAKTTIALGGTTVVDEPA